MSEKTILSGKKQFNKYNLKRTAEVLAWSGGSAVLAIAAALLSEYQAPVELAFLVPGINTLVYAVVDWLQEQADNV